MRVTALLTIATSALTLAAVSTASATTKHHRHHVRHGVATTNIVPATPAWTEPYAPRERPYECMTDEGGGRFFPCDYGGGRR